MKLITLNTWGGAGGASELLRFFEKHSDVDIFCLQEVFEGDRGALGADPAVSFWKKAREKDYQLLSSVQARLPHHASYFRPHLKDFYGLAFFVKKGITVLEEGEHFVHKEKSYLPETTERMGAHARNIQYLKIMHNGKELCVINFHGLWNGQGKTDTEDRLAQSKKILQFTKDISTDFILAGDFNLLPDTESLKMIQNSGLKNLIIEHGITSTRTSYYTKPEKYADYVFVTPGLVVKDFKVLPDEVSDHSPLLLDFE